MASRQTTPNGSTHPVSTVLFVRILGIMIVIEKVLLAFCVNIRHTSRRTTGYGGSWIVEPKQQGLAVCACIVVVEAKIGPLRTKTTRSFAQGARLAGLRRCEKYC